MLASLALPAAISVSLTGFLLLVVRDRRMSILILALQYVGVCVLVALSWTVEMAVVKLVTGWMAGAVLGMAIVSLPDGSQELQQIDVTGVLFRLLLAVLVVLVMASLAPELALWVPGILPVQAYGGAILIGMGLVHLSLTVRPLRVVLGLLTVLSGFEILYAVVETSTLVSGLLAGITLGLALVGAYLLIAPTLEVER
jgi:uncharacterized membrane protein